jgi:hypothetical protein
VLKAKVTFISDNNQVVVLGDNDKNPIAVRIIFPCLIVVIVGGVRARTCE